MKRSRQLFTFCLLFVIALLAYSNVLNTYFLSDDFAQIGKVYEGDLSVTWGASHGGFFRPLFILSYFVDVNIWRLNPLGFHLTNVTLHAANAFLTFLLAIRLTRVAHLPEKEANYVAFAAALIFLLHPSHTEAVSWISGRADLLATLFCLLSLLAYESFVHTKNVSRLLFAFAAFALALLSKEAAICLPLAVLLVGMYVTRIGGAAGKMKDVYKTAGLFFLVAGAYVAWRAFALSTLIGGYGASQHLNFSHSTIVSQLLRFALRLLFPAIALESATFLESRALSPILIVVGASVLVLLIIVLTRRETRRAMLARVRRNTLLWLLLALSVCCFLPAINLRLNVFDTQGERYLYLPSAFFSIAFAYVLTRIASTPTARIAALACVLILYAATLWATNRNWVEAARVSQTIVADIASQARRDAVIVLNAPDNLRGAYIFRNGLDQALLSFVGDERVKQTHVVIHHRLNSPHDEIILTEDAGITALRPTDTRTEFDRYDAAPECLAVVEPAKRLARFRLDGCSETFDVFYFSEGRMRGIRAE